MSQLKLSVVIPAYNEAKNIGSGSLAQVDEYLKKQDYPYEVLIVDDGSTDNTADLIEKEIEDKKNFKLVRNPHGGKALTVISGMLKASGDIAVFTDMDQATPIDQIEKFLPKFAEGCDIVIGLRSGRKGAPLIRKLAPWVFLLLRGLILGLFIKDTQCGFKAFNQKSIKAVFPQMQKIWEDKKAGGAAVNAGFDVELLYLSKKSGFKIAEIPVEWKHVGTERVHMVHDAIEAVKDIIRIRIGDFRGAYA